MAKINIERDFNLGRNDGNNNIHLKYCTVGEHTRQCSRWYNGITVPLIHNLIYAHYKQFEKQ